MESRLSALSALSPVSPGTACGCIFLIRSDPAHAHLLAQPARAALAAADSVLHDDDVDPRILALVPHGAFVEPVASDSDCTPAKSPAIARARKLASEGWRVVWLVSDDDGHPSAALAVGGTVHVCTDVCAHESQAAAVNGRGPKPLATAFNGLAG
jgi:siroheme synthase